MKRLRRVVPHVALASSAGLVVLGLALIYPPAAFIGTGFALFAIVTFDPDRASRLTWPR